MEHLLRAGEADPASLDLREREIITSRSDNFWLSEGQGGHRWWGRGAAGVVLPGSELPGTTSPGMPLQKMYNE